MPALAELPLNLSLKVTFLAHFLFVCLTTMRYSVPFGYLLCNLAVLAFLVWAIVSAESVDAIQLAFTSNLCAIGIDLFVIIFCFRHNGEQGIDLALTFTILQMIARPFTTYFMLRVIRERTGNPELLSNIFPKPRDSRNEDVARRQTVQPGEHAAYDFVKAEQI